MYSSKWRTFKKQESGSTYVELLMMSQKNQDSNADGILRVAPLFKNTRIGTSCNTNIGHRFYGHKTTNGPWSSLPIIINALLHPLLFVVYSFLMTSQLDRCCLLLLPPSLLYLCKKGARKVMERNFHHPSLAAIISDSTYALLLLESTLFSRIQWHSIKFRVFIEILKWEQSFSCLYICSTICNTMC